MTFYEASKMMVQALRDQAARAESLGINSDNILAMISGAEMIIDSMTIEVGSCEWH